MAHKGCGKINYRKAVTETQHNISTGNPLNTMFLRAELVSQVFKPPLPCLF